MDHYIAACRDLKVKPNAAFVELGKTSKEVDLSRNYLGADNGFSAFLAWLAKSEATEHIDLSGCHLTTENVKDLVDVCLTHPSVTSILLHSNRLFVESGTQLVRLARFNANITALGIRDGAGAPHANHIPDRLVRKIEAHLQYNIRLTQGARLV
jgi:hypothetical protein